MLSPLKLAQRPQRLKGSQSLACTWGTCHSCTRWGRRALQELTSGSTRSVETFPCSCWQSLEHNPSPNRNPSSELPPAWHRGETKTARTVSSSWTSQKSWRWRLLWPPDLPDLSSSAPMISCAGQWGGWHHLHVCACWYARSCRRLTCC